VGTTTPPPFKFRSDPKDPNKGPVLDRFIARMHGQEEFAHATFEKDFRQWKPWVQASFIVDKHQTGRTSPMIS